MFWHYFLANFLTICGLFLLFLIGRIFLWAGLSSWATLVQPGFCIYGKTKICIGSPCSELWYSIIFFELCASTVSSWFFSPLNLSSLSRNIQCTPPLRLPVHLPEKGWGRCCLPQLAGRLCCSAPPLSTDSSFRFCGFHFLYFVFCSLLICLL